MTDERSPDEPKADADDPTPESPAEGSDPEATPPLEADAGQSPARPKSYLILDPPPPEGR
jgi:hypothetical protein